MEKQTKIGIKEILPVGWLDALVEITGFSQNTVSAVVNQEKISHPAWPHVLDLAEKEKKRLLEVNQRTKDLIGEKPISQGKMAAMRQPLG
jgi:hypothetical protein